MDYANRTASIRIETNSEEMGDLMLAVVHGLQLDGYEVISISPEYKNRNDLKVRRYINVKRAN